MNTDASESSIGAQEAPLLLNLLPRPGKLVMRGPLRTQLDPALSGDERLYGAMIKGDAILLAFEKLTLGTRDVKGTGKRYSGTAWADQTGLTSANAPCDFNSVSLGGKSYALASSNGVIRWDGTAVAPTQCTNSPTINSVHLAVHLQRLFVFISDHTLTWTDTVDASKDLNLLASWQDDASGLTNSITVGGDDGDDPIAIASLGRSLAIFKRRSTYLLRGDTPSSFTLQRVAADIGCVDAGSVLSYDNGVFFLSDNGFYFYDGVEFKHLSRNKVQQQLLTVTTDAALRPPKGTIKTGYGRTTHLGNGLVLLVIGSQDVSNPHVTFFSMIYDVHSDAWMQFSSDALSRSTSFCWLMPTTSSSMYQSQPLGWDSKRLVYLGDISRPDTVPESERGKDVLSSTKHINAKWQSRLGKLTTPGTASRVARVHLDYKFVPDNAVAEGTTGWFVSAVDGSSATVLPEVQVATQVDPPGQLGRKRAVMECHSEANDVQVRVEWRGVSSPPALATAEIYEAAVEYEPAQQRSSY